MNSPFYEAEQRRLYPHRIMVTGGAQQIAEHMKQLIDENKVTLQEFRTTTLGQLQYKFFINGTTDEIMRAFAILKTL